MSIFFILGPALADGEDYPVFKEASAFRGRCPSERLKPRIIVWPFWWRDVLGNLKKNWISVQKKCFHEA
jgi:hypothetical protein